MNLLLRYILTTLLVILFFSCSKVKKSYDEYLPEIKLVSVTPQVDGSVIVEGAILSKGEAPVDFAGFCISATSTPEMLDRQFVSKITDKKFYAQYFELSEDSVYKFRAWATNEYGYSYSNILTVDSFVFPSVDAPCTLPNNYLSTSLSSGTYNGTTHNISWSSASGLYNINGSLPTTTVNMYFTTSITQGYYTTTSNPIPGYREMKVTFVQWQNYVLKPGSTIYVKKLNASEFEITICDAPFLFNGSTWLDFNTRLVVIK